MWFRRRKKPLIKICVVLCLLLLVICQLYSILVRHESSVDELRLGGRNPGLNGVIPPQRPGQDGSLDVNDSAQKGKGSKDAGRRLGAGQDVPGVTGKFGERIGEVLDGVQPRADRDQAEVFRSHEIGNRTSSVNSQRRLQTELKDIFISVKTTGKFHKARVEVLLKTWVGLAADQTYFFTDTDDAELISRTNGHAINTNCSSIHSREGLCCKMAVELEYFMKFATTYRWFCHVDDDTYINIPALLRHLQQYDHIEDWYMGKPSLNHPLEIPDPDHQGERVSFWFATGGAGICISRGLALKMVPYITNGRLEMTCTQIRLPDDCTIAFIIHRYLSSELTLVSEFHSHLEALRRIQIDHLAQQITLSYSQTTGGRNILKIPGFDDKEDPTRFLTIHCFLFPTSTGCPQQAKHTARTEDST